MRDQAVMIDRNVPRLWFVLCRKQGSLASMYVMSCLHQHISMKGCRYGASQHSAQ